VRSIIYQDSLYRVMVINNQPISTQILPINEDDNKKVTGYRFIILGLVMVLSFSSGLTMIPFGPITPLIIDHYGVDNRSAGLLTSIIFLVHVLLAIPASTLVGRLSLKHMITIGGLLGSISLFTFIATNNFALLLGMRVVYGSGFILLFAAIAPMVMQWFKPRELPLVNGAFIVTASAGMAGSTFVVVPLSDLLGWESAISVFGGICLIGAVLWIVFGKAFPVPVEERPMQIMTRVLGVLRSKNTLLIAAADVGPFAFITVCLAWLPTFYHQEYGMSLIKAGNLMGIMSTAGIAALVMASILSLRLFRRRPFLIAPGILIGFAGLGTFLVGDGIALYVVLVALGFASWFYLPVLMTIPMELYPDDPRRVSLTFASLMSIGGLANFVAVPIAGALFDSTGSLVPGLTVFAVMSWSLAISGWLLPETGTARRGQGGTYS
jgi:cyanate permease